MMRFGRKDNRPKLGFTLLELVVATTILSLLAMMVMPVAYMEIKREKERQLRHALWEIRDAIDRYKDFADKGSFQTKAGSNGYPPDLDTLVKGVEASQSGASRIKFLRRIPRDPMTNSTDWGMRSNQDDPDSDSWDGQAVFDVHTKSDRTALDGTKYRDW
jgi:general secretion pathway protein G